MEHRINIVELLKNCPSGMELDSTLYYNIFFDKIYEDDDCLYPIKCYTIENGIRDSVDFTEFGEFHTVIKSKCVIFPKGKNTWEGFVPPCFKEGDVVISAFGDIHLLRTKDSSYCSYRYKCENKLDKTITTDITVVRFATEEEKAKLFQAIKDNGYKWNTESKALEKLVTPKFKVGDWIVTPKNKVLQITSIEGTSYSFNNESHYWEICYCDEKCHLWTIDDAKDGDVLAFNDDIIVIFKDLYNKTTFHSYCHIEDGVFSVSEKDVPDWWNGEGFKPANKEQHDALFAKMKEAGYEWNETKTLKKLVTPKFKVGIE